jgi:hypothetical protein
MFSGMAMRKGLMAAAVAAGMLAAGGAWAGDYYPITSSAEHIIVIDLGGLVVNGSTTTAKFLWIRADADSFSGSPVGHIEVLEEFRCATKESRRAGLAVFDPAGKPLGGSQGKGDWKTGEPGTAAETMIATVCDPGSRDLEQVASMPTAEMVAKARKTMAEPD